MLHFVGVLYIFCHHLLLYLTETHVNPHINPLVCLVQTCNHTLTQIPDYIQIVGIILGMCTLGYLGDKIGRKWGSVFTASIMFIGAILLVATDAPTDKGFVIFYIISQVPYFHAQQQALQFVPFQSCSWHRLVLIVRRAVHTVTYYTGTSRQSAAIPHPISGGLCLSCICLLAVPDLLQPCLLGCSSLLVTVWEASTLWLLDLLLSVLKPRAVLLQGSVVER